MWNQQPGKWGYRCGCGMSYMNFLSVPLSLWTMDWSGDQRLRQASVILKIRKSWLSCKWLGTRPASRTRMSVIVENSIDLSLFTRLERVGYSAWADRWQHRTRCYPVRAELSMTIFLTQSQATPSTTKVICSSIAHDSGWTWHALKTDFMLVSVVKQIQEMLITMQSK